MSANPLLEAQALHKAFKDVNAVNGVSFQMQTGQCFGLLGPNGAGKTTTIELLEGIQAPDSGTIVYKGDPIGKRFREEAGIVFQHTALQEFITVQEVLNFFKALYRKTIPLDGIIEQCNLQEFLNRDTRKLSGGQRQRLLLGVSLINDPEIVFLDEPTTGLDPQARRNFWDLINSIKAQGKTILLTTHYMDEAQELCDEIAIMDHGQIIAQDTPDALLSKHFNDVVVSLPRALQAALPPLTIHRETPDRVEFLTADVNTLLHDLLKATVPLQELRIRQRNLEDLFLELTGRELRQ